MLIRQGNLKIPFISLKNVNLFHCNRKTGIFVVICRPIYISLEFTVELQKNNSSHGVDEV